ncbi:DsbA family oxidoreductase [Maritimibacter sp. UBA3975]|uniref:DsbA family oxidoreductase n=1 Tax=Maritimibacter sp. UBA3975 TaxID=1946833 RepID=UPI000C0931D7|nr:DsbA family oxidoreductase [Maritimibacter sp. UBA3975]MAM62406.1 polyketide biosynthesis protein [Maritimibacter sp.]|tara:strand:+ start:29316 stop:29960 length:645 start_codon:yes stop_codon:yes gene_type:complete
MIKLYIFSDPICPWCYIGKARLDAALEQRPNHPFEIEWHPFMLNPTMPAEGMDRRAYLEGKFGGKEGAVQAYLPVVQEAEASGLQINFDAIGRTPSTLDAHRLIHWAHLEGRQTAVVSRLFKSYFIDGQDIGDRTVLADIAESTGMDRAVTERLFESGADADNIKARDMDAREKGVSAVPTFVIANQHVVPGAQPTDLWLKVIDELVTQVEGEA